MNPNSPHGTAPLALPDGRRSVRFSAFILFFLTCTLACARLAADVDKGSKERAEAYFRSISKTLQYSTPEGIFQTTLDDVAAYLGYKGLTARDLQNLPSEVLMNPARLLGPGGAQNPAALRAGLGSMDLSYGEIRSSAFFAPKIMNIKDPEATRNLGWRKMVQLRGRPLSGAQQHQILYGIILFNIFTKPGAQPFQPGDESVNTQVMLVTAPSAVPKPGTEGPSTVYWLDYDRLSLGGRLSLALNAAFDANELPPGDGLQPYFVPTGCVACHASNERRSLVNFLDTDHWFDRLNNDFQSLKAQGLPLLFDGKSNDPNSPGFRAAFDIIRGFNHEADEQTKVAQPKHDETLASAKWSELHAGNYNHIPPIFRAIGPEPQWSAQRPGDLAVLDALNQYCYRCHGTVKFSVFNRQAVFARWPNLKERLRPDAPTGVKMPPDRDLPENVRQLIINAVP